MTDLGKRAASFISERDPFGDHFSALDLAKLDPTGGYIPGELNQVAGVGMNPLKLDTDKQVFFYEQDFYVLSNFSAFNLRWKSREFPTLEHAYHWEKFAHQNPPGSECDACYVIRRAPSAHDAFTFAQIGRAVGRRADWNEVRVDIMRDLLRAKVEQHEYVRRKLLATGDRELVENSWRDDFWGWGPNRDGKNMLGKLWMEIRDELRATAGVSEYSEHLAWAHGQ